MRARLPDTAGDLDRGCARIGYEVYEATEGGPDVPTLVLVPTWLLATARIWKAQIPYLPRHPEHGAVLAAETGGRPVIFEGNGHGVMGREPVRVNLLIREFVESVHPSAGAGITAPFTRARARPRHRPGDGVRHRGTRLPRHRGWLGLGRRHVPDLRMVVVTGPRIDPDSLPTHEGLDVRAFVPQLYRHLAACDLALVQGGLTTGMELTATRRPFLYFPLGHHLVQSFHVHHRLRRYRAGRRVDFASTDPDGIAEAIATELSRPVDYRTDESDGAARGRPRGRARLSPASTPGGSSWPNHLTSPHSPAGH